MNRYIRSLLFLCVVCSSILPVLAQSAQISGAITDPRQARVKGAQISVVNQATGVAHDTTTNEEGFFVVPFLQPGTYKAFVKAPGFSVAVTEPTTITTGQALVLDVQLRVGGEQQTVTVTSVTPLLNTTDGSVSTIVDQQFVANMPLNGRSFQDLLSLAPGVSPGTPQVNGSVTTGGGTLGDFSVNGQTYLSNNYIVDGVSANYSGSGTTTGAVLPAETILGTTQSLLSVDAMQEVRIETSSYSAEYGRASGGQFSFTTRGGTDKYHGSAYEYLRNNYFDANDWFNDYNQLAVAPYRQNDFGGTAGGPIVIPRLYNGKDKAFFFISYEGLRLMQPQTASSMYVPSLALRQSAASVIQPVLNGFPTPNTSVADQQTLCSTMNGATGASDGSNTIGYYNGYPCPVVNGTIQTGTYVNSGMAPYNSAYSTPTNLDAYSARFDYNLTSKMNAFFRASYTPSTVNSNSGYDMAVINATHSTTKSYTLGVNSQISSRLSNSLRLNYGYNTGYENTYISNFGGATPFDFNANAGLSQYPHPSPSFYITIPDAGYAIVNAYNTNNWASQWNLVDTVSFVYGHHQFKLGADYRRVLTPLGSWDPMADITYGTSWQLQNNWAGYVYVNVQNPAKPLYQEFSLFAQDEWRVNPRLKLSLGLRWDVNPPPTNDGGAMPLTLKGDLNTPSAWTMSSTALWKTAYLNFAPRLGAAYLLRSNPDWETVVRIGGGVYFGTNDAIGENAFQGVGNSGNYWSDYFSGQALAYPFTTAQVTAATPSTSAPYTNGFAYYYPQNLQLPYSLAGNLSIQQALGKSQSITASYIGSTTRRSIGWQEARPRSANTNYWAVYYAAEGNTPPPDYNALQVSYQRQMRHGLQALASYTWSHTIDGGGTRFGMLTSLAEQGEPVQRASADNDLRHNFSAALSWNLPSVKSNRILDAGLSHWGLDSRIFVRSGYPVRVVGPFAFSSTSTLAGNSGVEMVAGQPLYLYGQDCTAYYAAHGNPENGKPCPGGRAINPAAFKSTGSMDYSPAPRNIARGFGMSQVNLAARREFPIKDGVSLLFRAEAFNIFNHPNFGSINGQLGSSFGLATNTLATSGIGAMASMYQPGGARSLQFALKVQF